MIGCTLTNACSHKVIEKPVTPNEFPLFEILPGEKTGIDFVNEFKENAVMNGLMYEYIYNGAGLAAADFNNDGLVDLYFISNLKRNQFYLNKGGLTFENTTKTSGLGGGYGFPVGVTVVDINYDGLLDIYVCRSGSFDDPKIVKNQLFINQGNNSLGVPEFREKAAKYNLDISQYSTQAAFFDYDRDGDLDMFLINYGLDIYPDDLIRQLMTEEASNIGERLYRNDNQKFRDVTKEAGIVNSKIGFGLGIGVGDLNNDGWPDILVSNDYSEKDHLYINNKNGTFKEVSKAATKHISNFSMGNDIADFNNDGWLDFITLDMMADNNYDIKTSMSGMDPSRFNYLVESGLHYQYMYNALQLNNGTPRGTDIPLFSDIAQLSGVSSTDWSWAPLFFDMDNDGNQDLFVSNGIKRDFRNNDFIKLYGEKQQLITTAARNKNRGKISQLILESLSMMPTRQKPNIFFKNKGDLTFEKMNSAWNLKTATTTNGAVYADLDNDGDMDVVGNNMDSRAVIYENKTSQIKSANYLPV